MPQAKPRRWIWFFVILALLAATAMAIPLWYNSSRQLTAEQLADARARWKENGPRDYDFRYTTNKSTGKEEFKVRVRDNKVRSVTRNNVELEERLYRYHDMPALFGFIEEFLKQDTEEARTTGRRVFTIADFDARDGHLLRYIRSPAMRKDERVEIRVEDFQPVER
jgi:hypothetical protein